MEVTKDFQAYLEQPSCKLDTLVEIVKHHLQFDGALGITPSHQSPHSPLLVPSQRLTTPIPSIPTQYDGMPDKIIVYSYFVTSFPLIELVRLSRNHIIPQTRSLILVPGTQAPWH